jgi:hypothetical protein
MEVDFNNARLQALNTYNELVDLCDRGHSAQTYGMGIDLVTISAFELSKILRDLRDLLVTIGCAYLPGDETCTCVCDEDMEVKVFGDVPRVPVVRREEALGPTDECTGHGLIYKGDD